MTIEDKHTLLIRRIQGYADTAVDAALHDAYQKDVTAAYRDIGPAIQDLMLEVAEATVCAIAVGDQRSMGYIYEAARSVMADIEALGEGV